MRLNISKYRPTITKALDDCKNYLSNNISGGKMFAGGLLFVSVVAAADTGDVDALYTQIEQINASIDPTTIYSNITTNISNIYDVVGNDNNVNIQDITKIAQEVGSNNTILDVTGDGLVTVADVEAAYQNRSNI
ncbi:hypothetical protein GQ473_01935 [archaeon]|nr:hypothetical protein [archaeon]